MLRWPNRYRSKYGALRGSPQNHDPQVAATACGSGPLAGHLQQLVSREAVRVMGRTDRLNGNKSNFFRIAFA